MSYEIVKHWTSKAGLKAWVLLVNGGSHHCGYVEIPEALLDKNFYDYICDDEEYCINECESMADQLINLIPKLGFNNEIQNSNG